MFYHMCVLFMSNEYNDLVKQSQEILMNYVSQKHIQQQVCDITYDEEDTSRANRPSIMKKSPFSKMFTLQREQAERDILSESQTGRANTHHCAAVIDVLLQTYMGIFPLWSGLLLGVLGKTRDTNCHVETWFGIVKHFILQKRKHLRPAEFINKMFNSLQGRYVEHIVQHNLPIEILGKHAEVSRPDDDHEEQWHKRDSSASSFKSKSKYFNPPQKIPQPKVPALKDHTDRDKQITLLWKKKDTEVVVAAVPTKNTGWTIAIHHREFRTLQPHKWLVGEVMEGLFHIAACSNGVLEDIYLMDHYTAGVILKGNPTVMSRHTLKDIMYTTDFDNYVGILSFVHVNNNHWNLLYIHSGMRTVYLMDPAAKSSEIKASKKAADRIQ